MNAITSAHPQPSTDLAQAQQICLNAVMAQAKLLNAAIARAVDSGLIVEVGRASRYHTDAAAWGDQITAQAQPRD